MKELSVRTSQREEMIDITHLVRDFAKEAGITDGICHVFVPHTTCGILINENADPDVTRDILDALRVLAPATANYRHVEGNSPAHIKSSLVGCSKTLMLANGRLCLGTWQGIFLCEFDGPRHRKVWLQVVG
ncbi:MAG TPA: YjbQ family protein [Clostridia bacterium]|nr:YjbQ family protein [Clostridia bacterium]